MDHPPCETNACTSTSASTGQPLRASDNTPKFQRKGGIVVSEERKGNEEEYNLRSAKAGEKFFSYNGGPATRDNRRKERRR